MRYILPIWKLAPFFRLLVPAIIGIVFGWYSPMPLWAPVAIAMLSFISFLILHFFSPLFLYRWHLLPGCLLFVLVMAIFFGLTIGANPGAHKNWYGHFKNADAVELKIISPPVLRGSFYKTDASVVAVIKDGNIHQTSGQIYLYLKADSVMEIPKPGYILLSKVVVQPIKNTGNPGGFNYARYCAFEGVYHAIFARRSDWKILMRNKPGKLRSLIIDLRQYAISCIRKHLSAENDIQGIAEALVVGYKEELSKDLLQAYSNTGVVHIIAISGLHLALVYYILTLFVSRIPGLKKKVWIQSVFCIACLWIFSLVSGASASVLRSAVMFSFVLAGKSFGFSGSIANSLACSAFFLLMYNPYFLWDIGFQLSYLAVVGIVALQEPLYRLLFIKHKVLRYLWKACTVSISAQITTLPLCLYYFHQFPGYFLPANLIAVPLSSAILVVEFFLIAFSWVTPVAMFAGKIAAVMIQGMNLTIQFIDQLPGATIRGIFFPFITCILISACILFFGLALRETSFRNLKFGIYFLLMALMVNGMLIYIARKDPIFIVYNIPGHSSADFIQGGKHVSLGDTLLSQQKVNRYVWEPSRTMFASAKVAEKTIPQYQPNLIEFHHKRILRIDSVSLFPGKVERADILIISHNARIDMDSLLRKLKPGLVVFDASNNLWKIAKWKSICDRLALPCFSVPEQGAFVYFPLRK